MEENFFKTKALTKLWWSNSLPVHDSSIFTRQSSRSIVLEHNCSGTGDGNRRRFSNSLIGHNWSLNAGRFFAGLLGCLFASQLVCEKKPGVEQVEMREENSWGRFVLRHAWLNETVIGSTVLMVLKSQSTAKKVFCIYSGTFLRI